MTSIQQWRERAPALDRLDCDVLIAHALRCNRAEILAHPERPLAQATVLRLNDWRERRLGGEPLAYILQTKEFWGLEFRVTPAVLIPRPETELLVEQALAIAQAGDRLLELGTGCGAPAIALSLETARLNQPLEVTASDISHAALAVAQDNGAQHQAPITWLHSDWFSNIHGQFQIIISNPPYVASGDAHLADLGSEPALALVAGSDGLDAIRRIVATANDHLAPGGWLLLEHGYQQGSAVLKLLNTAGYVHARSERDLNGHPRVTLGRKPQ